MKTKKTYRLDVEEKEILRAFESGAYVSVPQKEKMHMFAELQSAAKNTLAKTRSITLRVSDVDLHRIKVRAHREGLPYQTYINSLLHKVVA